MARIVINPTTFENSKDALCVAFDEGFRILMEEMAFEPQSEPTAKQRDFLKDTAYADDELQLRRTILARICTFDTSVSDPTDEQLQEAVDFLRSVLETGAPQNQWEQNAVTRILSVIEKAVGSGVAEPRGTEMRGDGGAEARAAEKAGGSDIEVIIPGDDEEESPVTDEKPPEQRTPDEQAADDFAKSMEIAGMKTLGGSADPLAAAGIKVPKAGATPPPDEPKPAQVQPAAPAAPQADQKDALLKTLPKDRMGRFVDPAGRVITDREAMRLAVLGNQPKDQTQHREAQPGMINGRALTQGEMDFLRKRHASGATLNAAQLAAIGEDAGDQNQITRLDSRGLAMYDENGRKLKRRNRQLFSQTGEATPEDLFGKRRVKQREISQYWRRKRLEALGLL